MCPDPVARPVEQGGVGVHEPDLAPRGLPLRRLFYAGRGVAERHSRLSGGVRELLSANSRGTARCGSGYCGGVSGPRGGSPA